MKKKKDYTIPLLIMIFVFALLTSCKKNNEQPIVEDPITPIATNINITASQYCNKGDVLPNVLVNFYYDKAQSDTALPIFKAITDSLGLATIKNVKIRSYYYRYAGKMIGSCNKSFSGTNTINIREGENTLRISVN